MILYLRVTEISFTDQGQTGLHDPTGLVYRYSIDGCLRKVINTIPSPNGIVLNRSEKTIIVAVTRANAVWLIPMTKNGGATKVGLFAQLPSPGPDGLAIDDAGNIAVAHPGLGIVWLYDRSGIPIFQVRSCAGKMVTNIAYGGQDNLFIYHRSDDWLHSARRDACTRTKNVFTSLIVFLREKNYKHPKTPLWRTLLLYCYLHYLSEPDLALRDTKPLHCPTITLTPLSVSTQTSHSTRILSSDKIVLLFYVTLRSD